MPKSTRVMIILAILVGILAGACSAKVEVGGGDTTTTKAKSTTEPPTTDDTGSEGTEEAPPIGATETIGGYTFTIVDPSEFISPEPGMTVTAAEVTDGSQQIALLMRLTSSQADFDATMAQDILAEQSGGGTVSTINIAGKSGFITENPAGQVIVGRADEDTGSFGVFIGFPGVTKDQMVAMIEAVSAA